MEWKKLEFEPEERKEATVVRFEEEGDSFVGRYIGFVEYEKEGERISLKLIENAHAQVRGIEEAVERQIASELNQANNEIRSEVIMEAISNAKQRLQSEITSEVDKDLRVKALDCLM